MREWNLKAGDPLSLLISADARLGPTDYCDDQTWELSLDGGEPPALALQTTLGLRASTVRLFPRFIENQVSINDPANFHVPPALHQFYPNYLSVSFSPLENLKVKAEFWVPDSKGVSGRLHISNHTSEVRRLQIEWIAILMAAGAGSRMAPAEFDHVQVLAGSSGGLAPLLFMTGGPQASTAPHPALSSKVELLPDQEHTLTWTFAGLADARDSFDFARQLATKNWDAELARIEMLNQSGLEIYTGDPDWDAAFALSQQTTYRLFLQGTSHLESPSILLTRQPDQGYSFRGDGRDYNYSWNGQTPLDTYYACSLLLPASPDLAQGLLRNFIRTAQEDGFIDWKPGLGGQRSQLLATPILSSLTWKIFQFTQDTSFLHDIYKPLLDFLQVWFSSKHDRDGDGIPEWDHVMQAGFDDHPLFSPWQEWSQGADITSAESPGLCAMLYNECLALQKIARELGLTEASSGLQALADNLHSAIELSWDPVSSSYHYWDRDSHSCPDSQILGQRLGPGEILLERHINQPARLLFQLQLVSEVTRPIRVSIYGSSPDGENICEVITHKAWRWQLVHATATGEKLFSYIERVSVEGVDDTDLVRVQIASLYAEDQSMLLPLWAGVPSQELAEVLVRNTIGNPARYWQPFGIPASLTLREKIIENSSASTQVHLPWNLFIGEGLLAYGFQEEAVELTSRLMRAIIRTLKQDRSFRKYYHPETGRGSGDSNSLDGLAPLSLFLDCLGVKLISPKSVYLRGFNPFPWPVTVKYRGLSVLRQVDKTTVIFPTGETISVSDPSPCIVSIERENLDN